jgi:hypothetical protein
MNETNSTYLQHFQDWSFQNYNDEQILNDLKHKGFVEEKIEEIIQLYKKKKRNDRSTKGFIFIAIGAITGFMSCLLTLLNIFPAYHDFILVGLTTIGISIAVYGCYLIFE